MWRVGLVGVVLAGGAPWGASPARAQAPGLPASTLEVATDAGAWVRAWRSDSAPRTYDGTAWPGLAPRGTGLVGAGLRLDRYRLRGSGEAFRTELYVVRLDPDSVRLALDTAFRHGARAWTLDRAGGGTVFAVNAGQFVADLPWGWVQLDGRTYLPPGRGPLVTTVAIGRDGRMTLLHGAKLPGAGDSRWAFQSYPTLLAAGDVPTPLRAADQGVDVAHRDARLAIGTRHDGSVVLAMTRFGALGEAMGRLPFGLTTPEMAAVMGLLGTEDAVLLDGGISAQLLVRGRGGVVTRLSGLRSVPLALVAMPKNGEYRAK
jgi:hypothetical protein